MAIANGSSIEAVLTLNGSGFESGLTKATNLVKNFVTQVNATSGNVNGFKTAIDGLVTKLNDANLSFTKFQEQAKGIESFNKFANGVKALATAVDTLGKESNEASTGVSRVKEIIKSLEGTLGVAEVKITGISNALRNMANSSTQSLTKEQQLFNNMRNGLNALALTITRTGNVITDQEARAILELQKTTKQVQVMENEFNKAESELMKFANTGVEAFNRIGRSVDSYVAKTNMLKLSNPYNNIFDSNDKLIKSTELLEQNSIAMQKNGVEKLRNMGYTGQLDGAERRLAVAEKEVGTASNQESAGIQRANASMNQGVGSANRLTNATNRLRGAMSSLRMMGTMVGSMIAYNFAHNLAMATTETINAKSEMNGYFQMLGYTRGQVDDFNKSLEETVKLFPRLNKYALGETISSIGVEFELTTEEMKKAMPVVSMITSEYLRAGRNVNEASLAVKDILQGEFQRLSRETGVKGEQLMEAGWSGDKTDVMGLLEALEKVGKSRNWDVFVTKANSLNDAVLILQNRFSEWSADMVERIQPTIVGVFNALMDVGGMFSQALTGIIDWLSGGSWEASATQIVGLGVAIGVVSQALVLYRSELGLVEASQLGLKGSIASLITGLNGQKVAEVGVFNSIKAKILGINAEKVAQGGVTSAIQSKLVALRTEAVQQKLATVQEEYNTLAVEKNSIAQEINALQNKLNIAVTEGVITSKQAETLQEELNTASKELNTIATIEQEGANTGLIASLYLLGTGEAIVTGETSALAVAMGVLNGVIALSPIGWLTAGILALAGAFYVLSGGLDAHWDKMKTFNETLDNSDDIVRANNEHLEELKNTLGEDSEEYKNASESVETFNKKLGSSKALLKAYNDELSILPTKLSEITSANSKGLGISEEGMKELSEYATGLEEGQKTYYRALQVVHKQEDDFSKSERTLAQNMRDRNAEEEDIQNKRMQHLEHYNNFIKHSAEHNTSDDWWGGTWAGILAGIDSFQIWLDYKTEDLAQWWHDFTEDYSKLPEQLGEAWNNIDWGALGDIGGRFSQWINDVGTSLSDSWKSLTEMFDNNIKKPITDWWNGFISFDWLFGAVSASDGSSDHPSFMEDLSAIFGFDVQAWIDSFMADPLGTLGIDLGGFDILGTLVNFLFGTGSGDPNDISWALTFLQNNIITPITETWSAFISDPVAFIGEMGFTITGFLDSLFGTDIFSQIWTWVDFSIIQPFGTAIYNGIMSIPLVSDILALFGLVDGENSGSSQKGKDLGQAFKTAIEDVIRNIPILGDILQLLGLIPSANDDAHSKGKGVGENVDKGYKDGTVNLVSEAIKEFQDIANGIRDKAGEAYNAAKHYAGEVWNGLNSVFQRASPGFFYDQVLLEFGTDMPNAMLSSGDVAYSSAQYYGQQIRDGISSVNTDSLSLDSAIGNYETDAQMIASTSQMMGMETTTAFNDMSLAVNNTTTTMASNVGSTYSQMQTKQSSSLQSMKTQNQTAYNEMYLKSNQSLIQMRDSTSNITQQMVSAWSHMKNQLVATANQLKNESTTHFNNLSDTIGSFYRKIQNPSNWGAGGGSGIGVRGVRHPSAGKSIARSIRTRGATHHGAGGSSASPYNSSNKTMTLRALKNMICPSGNCDIFDGYDLNQKVNVADFLSTIGGEHGFGWSGWNSTHFNYIKQKSDEWDMKSPYINLAGGIDTNTNFKVKDFENGTPEISFSSFQSMAEAIFSAIPYRFYYDSAWKGSWLGALQSGACNCSDGADALIAFANACGFSGYKQHGTWRNSNGQSFGHFWAVINGHKMDTTGWQNQRTWTPSNSAGSPMVRRATHSSMNTSDRLINVTININEPVYGVDDLDDKIQDSVNKGLRREFNDPYTVELI